MVTHSQSKLNQTLDEEDFYLWINKRKYQLSSDIFPIDPPFTIKDVVDPEYLPD